VKTQNPNYRELATVLFAKATVTLTPVAAER